MSRYQGGIITKSPATPTGPTTTGRAPGIWRMDDVAYWTKQGVWPNANIQAPDASFPYVSLLLSTTALGNANNNLFVDSSGAFNPISRNGNTTQGSAAPYGASWSNFFDGSGDYLTAPDNAALQLGSSDFTIEFWVNFSVVPGAGQGATLVSKFDTSNTGYEVILYNNTMYFQAQTANIGMTYAFTPTAGTWYHIAWTRNGANAYGFINGALVASTAAASGSITNLAQALQIGRRGDNTFYLTGYMSNVRVVKGTAVYTAAFTPPTAPLTAITNTSLLTCQSNRFRDASTNNFTITVTGNTSVTEFAPFSPAYPGITYNQSDITNWSGYFDGTGDYLTVPSNAALNFGTGDFTWEGWIYANSLSNNPFIMHKSTGNGAGTGWFIEIGSGAVYVGPGTTGGTFATFSAASVTTNAWFHLAVTRVGTALTCFVNGTSVGTSTAAGYGSSYDNSAVFAIGGWSPVVSGYDLNGYISNARVVKGSAVYTANFTPPTTNLTAISGTSLLTLQNAAFTDNSTNNFVVTINGNTTVTGNSPFNTVGYWSNYFDGTGDYLETPSSSAAGLTGDWTVEAWVYPTSFASVGALFDCRSGGTGFAIYYNLTGFSGGAGAIGYATNSALVANSSAVINLNTWNHIAVVRSANTVTGYANGSSVFTYTETRTNATTTTYQIGIPSAIPFGYFSNFRVVRGTAIYSGSTITVPTAPLTAITNTSLLTCQNGRFIDNSTNNFTITVNGNPSVQSFDPFYTSTIASNGGSMYFDGTGDWLTVSNSPNIQFGANAFTVEFWANVSTSSGFRGIVGKGGAATGWAVFIDNSNFWAFSIDNLNYAGSVTPIYGSWTHVALVRSGTTFTLYINGTSVRTQTSSSSFTQTEQLVIGAGRDLTIPYTGYISNLRITAGTALYTAAFTPPTSVLTPSANTTLLVNGMNAGAYDATAINDMETVGNAQVTTAVSKFGGSSVAFDGSGDGLKFPSNAPMSMGTGNFTWEFWVNPATASAGYKSIIDTRTATLSDGFFFGLNPGTLQLVVVSNVTVLTASTSLTANTWQHVALVRSSGTLTIYLGGTSIGSVANSTNLTSAAGTIGLSDSISNPNPFNGYIDDLRVTRGVARYTANFTPPTQAFPTY